MALNDEIASITTNICTLKTVLKEKKTALKNAKKEMESLEAKEAVVESVLKKLLFLFLLDNESDGQL